MPESLLAFLVALFLIWPVLGKLALARFNRLRREAHKSGEIPDPQAPTEVLAHMYLWPLVLYKSHQSAKILDRTK